MGDEANPAMKPASSEQAVFAEALLRDTPESRAAYLDAACGADGDLRQRVEALLRAADRAGDFLETPPTGLSGETDSTLVVTQLSEKPGDKIGRYKLLQQIGEGGCGVVYMAEQEEPVRRRVALKVIKLGMDTKSVIARFEAERQALALMDHPNIAKVLDAGATETGRPYFVMELVRGIKITDYCDQNNISTEERLKLFTQVCHAIQHAHQKGIIHRDIKPSNILVTQNESVAVPKVIDFGIVKATTDQRLTDKTVFTAFEQFIGTPAYMSPEQAMMTNLDIDTRTDIYALGVLLYELLTGQTPFDAKDLMAAGLDAMRRTIREQEPARPSTRLSTMLEADLTTVAKHRHSEPAKLGTLLRGDLDWIVMKALEKDRTRRYETANALAMDLQRHLNNEPVVACPPSNLYRFQKLVRRNKLAFAAASAVISALILGLGVSTWMFFKEKQARQRAVAAEQEQARLRREAEAEVAESRRIAAFIGDLSQTFGQEGNAPKGESTYRVSLAMQMRLVSKEHPEINDALSSLAQVLQQGQLAKGDMTAREAVRKCHAAMAQFEKLASDQKQHSESWLIAVAYQALGHLFEESCCQTQEAEKAYRDTLILWRTMAADSNAVDDRWHLAINYDVLGHVLKEAGRFDEAAEAYRPALAIWRKLVAEFNNSDDYRNHLSGTLAALGATLQAAGKRTEGEQVFREAESALREDLARRKQRFGEMHREVEQALSSLARALEQAGKLVEAEAVWQEELAVEKKLSGEEHPLVANSLNSLAGVFSLSGRLSEAETTLREVLAMRRKRLGNEHLDVADSLSRLGENLSKQNRHVEAEATLREALVMRRKLDGNESRDVANLLAKIGTAEWYQDNFVEAEKMFREALQLRRKLFGNEHALVARSLSWLGTALQDQGKLAEAETNYRESLALSRKLPAEDRQFTATLAELTRLLLDQKKFIEAEPLARECLTIRETKTPDDWNTFSTRNMLGQSLLGQKKYAEAEPLLLSGYEGLKQRAEHIPAVSKSNMKTALRLLVQLYETTGQSEKAAEWKKKLTDFDQTEAAKQTDKPKP